MGLEGKTEKKLIGNPPKQVTIVVSSLTEEESRKMYPYRPFSRYSESRFGEGNTMSDDFAKLLNGKSKRCKMCKAPTFREYLIDTVCPDCDGRSEYNGKNPRE